MAARVTATGADELAALLGRTGDAAVGIAKAALYEGAGIMADAITAGIDSIRTSTGKFVWGTEDAPRLPSPQEKAALKSVGAGIAKFADDDDGANTIVGLSGTSGYVDVAGVRRPVPVIARSIESGTSFMRKQPFVRRAVSRTRAAAADKIRAEAEARINQLLES